MTENGMKVRQMEIYNKYKIEHTDGTPLKGKKYFVLRLDSDDPIEAARVARAMRAYEGKLRNCDLGNVNDQSERFRKFCKLESSASGGHCTSCRIITLGRDRCEFAWAQLPYTKEGVK